MLKALKKTDMGFEEERKMEEFIIEDGVLVKYKGKKEDVVIPDGVKEIGRSAFSHKKITSVVMPDSVEIIGPEAFLYCDRLEKIEFSKNLRKIGFNAFVECKMTEAIFYDKLEEIGGCAFAGCRKLENLVLPDHDIKMEEYVFNSCHSLANQKGFVIVRGVLYDYTNKESKVIKVPNGVKYIAKTTLDNNHESFDGIKLPASIEYIENGTFLSIVGSEEFTMDFKVSDMKEAERLVKRVFNSGCLKHAFLYGKFRADPLFTEALKKEILPKKYRDTDFKMAIEENDLEVVEKLLSCVKKLPKAELEEYINLSESMAVKKLFLDFKEKTEEEKRKAKLEKKEGE